MSRKVLLIDDEAGFTELLKMNLEKSGDFDGCYQKIYDAGIRLFPADEAHWQIAQFLLHI